MPKPNLDNMNIDAYMMFLRVRQAVRSSGAPRAHKVGDEEIAMVMIETIRILEATFNRLTREA